MKVALNIDNVTLTSGSKENRSGEVLGVMVFRGDELLTPEPITGNSFVEEFPSDVEEEYCIRVVYQDYSMACEQCVTVQPVNVEEQSANDINIYPNPTNGLVNVKVEDMTRISVVNTMGQVVYDKDVDNENETIDMTQYESGVYMLKITTENGIAVKKIMKL